MFNRIFWTNKFDSHCKIHVGNMGSQLQRHHMVDHSKRLEEKLFYWRSKIRIRDTHSPEEAVFCAIRDFADWYYRKYRRQVATDLDFIEDSNIIARTLEVLHNYVDQKRFAIPDVWNRILDEANAEREREKLEGLSSEGIDISKARIENAWSELIDNVVDEICVQCYEAILKSSRSIGSVAEITGSSRETAKLWLETFATYEVARKDSSGNRFGDPSLYRALYSFESSIWSEPPEDWEKRRALYSLGVLEDID